MIKVTHKRSKFGRPKKTRRTAAAIRPCWAVSRQSGHVALGLAQPDERDFQLDARRLPRKAAARSGNAIVGFSGGYNVDFVQPEYTGRSGCKALSRYHVSNRHRAELTKLDRTTISLSGSRLLNVFNLDKLSPMNANEKTDKLAQVAPVSKSGRGNEGGINAAARELGVDQKRGARK